MNLCYHLSLNKIIFMKNKNEIVFSLSIIDCATNNVKDVIYVIIVVCP